MHFPFYRFFFVFFVMGKLFFVLKFLLSMELQNATPSSNQFWIFSKLLNFLLSSLHKSTVLDFLNFEFMIFNDFRNFKFTIEPHGEPKTSLI